MSDEMIIMANGIIGALFIVFGIIISSLIPTKIEIQSINQVENGYYITINDEIYYKVVD